MAHQTVPVRTLTEVLGENKRYVKLNGAAYEQAARDGAFGYRRLSLSQSQQQSLWALCRDDESDMPSAVTALWSALISRYADQYRLPLLYGVLSEDETKKHGTEAQPSGFFPLIVDLAADEGWIMLTAKLQGLLEQGRADIPLWGEALTRTPASAGFEAEDGFNVWVIETTMERLPGDAEEADGLIRLSLPAAWNGLPELVLWYAYRSGEVALAVSYADARFEGEHVDALTHHLKEWLEVIAASPDQPLRGATIPAAPASETYPLSLAQRRLYSLHQLEGVNPNGSRLLALLAEGSLQRARFERALVELTQRHEALRTSFALEGGVPVQRIQAQAAPELAFAELAEAEAEAYVSAFVRPFDLVEAPLLRAALVKLEAERHLLLLDIHPIIADDVSVQVLADELALLYAGETLPVLRIQYKDYAIWEQTRKESERYRLQEAYWLEALGGELPVLQLPTDAPRPAVKRFEGGQATFTVGAETVHGLRRFALEQGVTLYIVLLAAYGVFLSKYSGQTDIVIGSPVAGRAHAGLERVLGLFANTMALRSYPQGDKTFAMYVGEMKQIALEAFEHADYRFEELAERLDLRRDLSRTPVFDAMFVLEDGRSAGKAIHAAEVVQGLGELRFSSYPMEQCTTNFELTFHAAEDGEALSCCLEYSAALFTRETAERMAMHLAQLLQAAASRPHGTLSSLELLPDSERERIVDEFNATAADYPRDATIHRLFEAQAARTPDHVAIAAEDARLTYRELNEQANRLARVLQKHGTAPQQLIAIMGERSTAMVVGILAILKAGGAYVPIDPAYPAERIRYMLDNSGAKLLLLQPHLQHLVDFAGTVISLEACSDHAVSREDSADLPSAAQLEDLAYVIYTSGTTGKPKGTLIEHKNVVRLLFNSQNRFDFHAGDTWTLFHSFCFDFSVWEMYGALLYGGKLVIVPALTVKHPRAFLDLLREERVTVLNQTPTYFYELLKEETRGEAGGLALRYVIFGGEALQPALLRPWKARYPQTKLINMYGITETTVHVTYKEITDADMAGGVSNIGAPIPTLRVYILDETRRLQPIGVPGELYVAGDGVGRGYLHRPELTAERFMDDPFVPGERMYKSGDAARWLPDGSLEYEGRIDNQVKIRGYRIELGEIEQQLRRYPGVEHGLVLVREAGDHRSLVAYYTAAEPLEPGKLISFAAASLPSYMIPSRFVHVASMPVTANGKVNRALLLSLDAEAEAASLAKDPKTGGEEEVLQGIAGRLLHLWRRLLKREEIGLRDHFYTVGGDSILAIQLVSLAKDYGIALTPRLVAEYPTVAALAAAVTEWIEAPAVRAEVLPGGEFELTPIQSWFFEQRFAEPYYFNQSQWITLPDCDASRLKQALQRLLHLHPALTLAYRASGSGFTQTYQPDLLVAQVDELSNEAGEPAAAEIEAVCEQWHRSLNYEAGRLLHAGIIRGDSGDMDRIHLTIHHLAIDGVSWRILLEDLRQCYTGAEPQPSPVSFHRWQAALAAYARRDEVRRHLPYWLEAEASCRPLPVDAIAHDHFDSAAPVYGEIQTALTAEQTRALLRHCARAYHTQINDLLLAAWSLTLSAWTGLAEVTFRLEGHGREGCVSDLDLSRTVGWFTSLFPVCVKLPADRELGAVIRAVKEQLRAVPDKGMSYGALRYLHADAAVRQALGQREPQAVFNYLGQFQAEAGDSDGWGHYTRDTAQDRSSGLNRGTSVLEVNCAAVDDCLHLFTKYSTAHLTKETAARLATMYMAHLSDIISHCLGQEREAFTPCDFPAVSLSQEAVDRLAEAYHEPFQLEQVLPLSPLQAGLLFHYLDHPESDQYVVQALWTYEGALEERRYRDAWRHAIEENDCLRLGFVWENMDEPVQYVVGRTEPEWAMLDWSELSEEAQRERMQAWLEADRKRGFDLRRPPYRFALIRKQPDVWTMVWSHHHIVLDGWTLPLLLNQVHTRLASQPGDGTPPGRLLPFSSYLHWLRGKSDVEAGTFWSGYLSGVEEATAIPMDRLSVEAASVHRPIARQRTWTLELDESFTLRLTALAKTLRVTLNTLVQFAWGKLLQVYNDTEITVFGMVVSGRGSDLPQADRVAGLLINTLPLVMHWKPDQSIREAVRRLQQDVHAMNDYSHVGLNVLKEWCPVGEGPLFHSIVASENYLNDYRQPGAGLVMRGMEEYEKTNYPITLTIANDGARVTLKFIYDADRLDRTAVSRLARQTEVILNCAMEHPDCPTGEISVMAAEEYNTIISAWKGTFRPIPQERTVPELFAEQVRQTPGAQALVSSDRALTYAELAQRAQSIADRLAGMEDESFVGVYLPRCMELPLALLGILQAGGVYVPLDPEAPAERTGDVIMDAGLSTIVTMRVWSEQLMQAASGFQGRWIYLDDPMTDGDVASRAASAKLQDVAVSVRAKPRRKSPDAVRVDGPAGRDACSAKLAAPPKASSRDAAMPDHPVGRSIDPAKLAIAQPSGNRLAYVMYTSGSTGKPKGVMVTQAGMIRLVKETDYFPFGSDMRLLLTGSPVFDASTFELWGTLLNGGRLHVVAKEELLDLSAAERRIRVWDINTLWLSTSLCHHWIDENLGLFAGVRRLLVGGEVLSLRHIGRLRTAYPELSIIHMYGPTENTTFSTSYTIHHVGEQRLPIGKPIANTTCYVLDKRGRVQPIGAEGELYVGGEGVARGYWRLEELTRQRFVPNPYATEEDLRLGRNNVLYRTGDRVRWLTDGNLEFLGRADDQVKIRGFRIEPSEVEVWLRRHPAVKAGTVTVLTVQGEKRLIAHYTANEPLPEETLRAFMIEHMPPYFVPSRFVQIDELPLTVNGKVDKKRLPLPEQQPKGGAAERTPTDGLQRAIADSWRHVLGIASIGIDDDFLSIGGHSLHALRIVARLQQEGYPVTVNRLLRERTIRRLAQSLVQSGRSAAEVAAAKETESLQAKASYPSFGFPLSAVQRRYFYRELADRSMFNVPYVSLLEQRVSREAMHKALTNLAERHSALRITFAQDDSGEWYQFEHEAGIDFTWVDLPEIPLAEGSQDAFISDYCAKRQYGFDLRQGPLWRAVVFDGYGVAARQVLFLVFHHSAFDGISMNLFLDELRRECISGTEEAALAPHERGGSYKDWCLALAEYAHRGVTAEAEAYWRSIVEGGSSLPTDKTAARPPTHRDMATKTFDLIQGEEQVHLFKSRAIQEQATPFECLLSALAQACMQLKSQNDVLLHVMSHQRESFLPQVSVHKTIGFFAGAYPIRLQAPQVFENSCEPGRWLNRVRDTMDRLPKEGLDYFVLRNMKEARGAKEALLDDRTHMLFHYLSQETDLLENDFYRPLPIPYGPTNSPDNPSAYWLNMTAVLKKDRLSLTCYYSTLHYEEDTIVRLGGLMCKHAADLIN